VRDFDLVILPKSETQKGLDLYRELSMFTIRNLKETISAIEKSAERSNAHYPVLSGLAEIYENYLALVTKDRDGELDSYERNKESMDIEFDGFTLSVFAEVEHSGDVSALYAGWLMLVKIAGYEVQGELLGSYRFKLFELHSEELAVSKTQFGRLLEQCERGISNCGIDQVLKLDGKARHLLARELVIQATKVLLKDQLKTQDELNAN